MLDQLQRETFAYFVNESNPENGLIRDKTEKDWPASIAATGLALASYPVGVERAFLTRDDAIKRTLATLRFFAKSHQGIEADATGYRGFYYHFLDMKTGQRTWKCELSTIDSTFLLAGALTAATYFDRDTPEEDEIREHANSLYGRVDWKWALNRGLTIVNGWKPETGFLKYRWQGYSEALLLYVLGLGSPTNPLPGKSYAAWTSTYKWKRIYGIDFLYAGPLFIHQLPQLWLDLRGVKDNFMGKKGIDYFENSRRATLVQQRYAIRNPRRFVHYGEHCWGITASDGPGPATKRVKGVKRKFFDYVARGVPYGPDDGTVAPWVVVASLPFAPEIVIPTIRHFNELRLREKNPYGFKATFNPTYPEKGGRPHGWVTPWHFGLNQGPIVMMIENYRSGFLWRLMQHCPAIMKGLQQAGFK
ncbi:MAG: glucoamylase family protein [Candidatus Acidiferrales bacterium]